MNTVVFLTAVTSAKAQQVMKKNSPKGHVHSGYELYTSDKEKNVSQKARKKLQTELGKAPHQRAQNKTSVFVLFTQPWVQGTALGELQH